MSTIQSLTDEEYAFHESETFNTIDAAAQSYYRAKAAEEISADQLLKRLSSFCLHAVMLGNLPRTELSPMGFSIAELRCGAQRAVRSVALDLIVRPSASEEAFWQKTSVLGQLEVALDGGGTHAIAMIEMALRRDMQRLGIGEETFQR